MTTIIEGVDPFPEWMDGIPLEKQAMVEGLAMILHSLLLVVTDEQLDSLAACEDDETWGPMIYSEGADEAHYWYCKAVPDTGQRLDAAKKRALAYFTRHCSGSDIQGNGKVDAS